ncbi:glutaredoxin 3 [Gammaproteobacteria bacterium LSUCC0057]|jgi:glutaredoxin 3|uniref:Glutaredoxin n=1 Tax=Gammaproteobacteria bacterium LSUCC0057 TaxID=2559237 RepID=A0A4Y8UER1_9GAMM|nr:glutaredoxin 3 [Gammaproteobacteria bacterium LSUCC0057]
MSQPTITVYTTRYCPYCSAATQLLRSLGLDFEEISADNNPELRAELRQRSGQHTVPQIWFGDHHVGGFSDLQQRHQRGELDALLRQ